MKARKTWTVCSFSMIITERVLLLVQSRVAVVHVCVLLLLSVYNSIILLCSMITTRYSSMMEGGKQTRCNHPVCYSWTDEGGFDPRVCAFLFTILCLLHVILIIHPCLLTACWQRRCCQRIWSMYEYVMYGSDSYSGSKLFIVALWASQVAFTQLLESLFRN